MRQVFASLLVALLGFAGARPAPAQTAAVSVELILDETFFLPGEDLPVGVRVSNLSGRPLTFGSTTNWLSFFIESKGGEAVTRLGPVPVEGPFTLESAKAGTKWWNLQPYFEFEQPGPYLVTAELRVPESGERVLSDPLPFTMQGASKLWEIAFGVPPEEGGTNTAAAPEIRRYALQSAARSKERKLYARVSDESGARIFKVVLLDRYLSFSNPQQQLDSRSRLHVLFQTGGSIYTYCVVSPNGDLTLRQRHEIVTNSRPRLAKQADGTIAVAGGRRLPGYGDVPPWEPPVGSAVETNAPAKTNAPAADAKKKGKESRRKKTGSDAK